MADVDTVHFAHIFFPRHFKNLQMQVVANVPQLPREEVWSRNEWMKWWGKYQTFKFREGKPRWLITSYGVLTAGIIIVLALPIIQTHKYSQNQASLLEVLFSLVLLLVNLFFAEKFCSIDPGIASFSLPIINQQQLAAYKNFCTQCKCTQNQSIKHCQFCDVCIEDSWYHSSIMSWCITKHNYGCFGGFWVTLLLQALLILA